MIINDFATALCSAPRLKIKIFTHKMAATRTKYEKEYKALDTGFDRDVLTMEERMRPIQLKWSREAFSKQLTGTGSTSLFAGVCEAWQGLNEHQHMGSWLVQRALELDIHMWVNGAALIHGQDWVVRLLLWCDLTGEQFGHNTSAKVLENDNVYSPYLQETREEFAILHDELVTLKAHSTYTGLASPNQISTQWSQETRHLTIGLGAQSQFYSTTATPRRVRTHLWAIVANYGPAGSNLEIDGWRTFWFSER